VKSNVADGHRKKARDLEEILNAYAR